MNLDEENQGRKKRNPETWKRNVVKKARLSGQSFVNTKGEIIPVRKTGLDCECRMKCFQVPKINPDEILSYFNSLDTKDIQDIYLQGLVHCSLPVHKRQENNVANEENSKALNEEPDQNQDVAHVKKVKSKSFTYTYYVRCGADRIKVCQKAFTALHGVNRKRVLRICKLLSLNKSPKDMRGKQRSGNAVPGSVCNKILEFVNSFELKQTHYTGSVKTYFADARLNIKILYELFTKQETCKMSYEFFRIYYNEHIGYSFGRPQVDVCMRCEEFSTKIKNPVLNDNAKRVAIADLAVHKRKAKKFYSKMKEMKEKLSDKESEFKKETLAICFDYMSNLPLPNIPVQEVYYLRQLWVYTFGIHELNTNKSTMYVYHEGVARKSPNEVCSWLWHYLEQQKEKGFKELVIFSDGAAGQNKNNCLIRFLMNLTEREVFEKITYYFPVRGHSFLPCDQDFGQIKRLVRKCDRIYNVEQYCELILKASKCNKFTVVRPTTDMVINYQKWWPTVYKRCCLSDDSYGRNVRKSDKITFQISKYNEFVFTSKNKGKLYAKTFIGGLQQHIFTLVPSARTGSQFPVDKAYNGKIYIDKKKMDNIKKLSQYIPGADEFWKEIYQWPVCEKGCDISDDESRTD